MQKLEIYSFSEHGGKQGNFIKSFLINSDINYNGWQISTTAIKSRLHEWIGKPIIQYITNKRTHPEYDEYDTAIREQEQYRVGTIIDVGNDKNTGNYWAVSEIHDEKIYLQINNNEVKHVSPSIFPKQYSEQVYPLHIMDGLPVHLALVDEPAYGGAAIIVGQCEGAKKQCKKNFSSLIANSDVENIRQIPLISKNISIIGNDSKLKITMPTDDIMDKKISDLSAEISEIKKVVSAMSDDKEKKEMTADDDTKKKEMTADEKEEVKEMTADDDTKKKGMTADEKEEVKELKTQNASLINIAKNPIINKILFASKNNGATELQIKNQTKFLNASTLPELQNFDINFISPFIINAENTTTQIPDISRIGDQLSGDVDVNNDTQLLLEAGVF